MEICVYADLSALEIKQFLPAYLPPQKRLSTVYTWDVYRKLRSISRSGRPRWSLSPRHIREFAYELSFLLTTILNTSFSGGVFPDMWKKATVSPVPKQQQLREIVCSSPVDYFKEIT